MSYCFFYGILAPRHRIPRGCRRESEDAFLEEVEKRLKNPFDGIQIFKTLSMGRGVKTTKHIRKGSVVAEYTGKLISSQKKVLRLEDKYYDDPDLTPGGYIFKINVEGKNYWLVLMTVKFL